MVNAHGEVYNYTGREWVHQAGDASDISIQSSKYVWTTGPYGEVQVLDLDRDKASGAVDPLVEILDCTFGVQLTRSGIARGFDTTVKATTIAFKDILDLI